MAKHKTAKYVKIIDEALKMPDCDGNGILRLFASVDGTGQLQRYSLVYINPRLYSDDNGRVLGYDNCHGYHHCHFMGQEKKVEFKSFEAIAEQFDMEWRALHEKVKDNQH